MLGLILGTLFAVSDSIGVGDLAGPVAGLGSSGLCVYLITKQMPAMQAAHAVSLEALVRLCALQSKIITLALMSPDVKNDAAIKEAVAELAELAGGRKSP